MTNYKLFTKQILRLIKRIFTSNFFCVVLCCSVISFAGQTLAVVLQLM